MACPNTIWQSSACALGTALCEGGGTIGALLSVRNPGDVLGRAARLRDGVTPHRAHVIPCARVHRDLRVHRFFGSLRREDDVWGVCLVESQEHRANPG